MKIKKLVFLFLFLLSSSFCFGADNITDNYRFIIPESGSRNWLEKFSNDMITIDSAIFILSNDAIIATAHIAKTNNPHFTTIAQLNAVESVVEGVAGPLEVNTTSNDVAISIASADEATAGTIDATQYQKINITSEDTGVHFAKANNPHSVTTAQLNAVGSVAEGVASPLVIQTISNDVLITELSADETQAGYISALQFAKINILSEDVQAISATTVIISNDVGESAIDTDQPKIQFTIPEPNNLPVNSRGDIMAIIWTNDSGKTFTVTQIQAYSDQDNYSFHLGITSTLTNVSIASQTTMDVVSCDVNGTNIFTDTISSGFDDATIADNQHLLFQHFENATSNVKVNIFGEFN